MMKPFESRVLHFVNYIVCYVLDIAGNVYSLSCLQESMPSYLKHRHILQTAGLIWDGWEQSPPQFVLKGAMK